MQNERKYIRVELETLSNIKRHAITKQLEEELKIKILNIGLGGIYVETDHPLPPDTLFEFDFKLPESDYVVKAKGMVTWVKKTFGRSGMGVKFIKVSAKDREAIMLYIQKRLTEKGLSLSKFELSEVEDFISAKGLAGLIVDSVHQDLLRVYFKEIGFELSKADIFERLNCDEKKAQNAIQTFLLNGLAQENGDKIKFFYSEDQKLRSQIENWIRENGL